MEHRNAILAMAILPMLISASALSALPKSDAEDASRPGTDIRNSEINIEVNTGTVNASGKDVNIGNVQAGKDGISNITISTAVNTGDINAKRDTNIGNVTFEKGDRKSHDAEAKKTDNIGNINIQSSRVTEVSTVIGAEQDEKIKERNKANTLKDSDGVDSRGIKHNYIGKDELKEAEEAQRKGEKVNVGNVNVAQDSGVKKVKTVIESLPGAKKKNSAGKTSGESDDE